MAESPLTSAHRKLIRTYEHVETLDAELLRFTESRPYRIVREIDPDTREHVVYAILEQDPGDEIALVLGDIVHNLRAALDHAVYGLSAFYLHRPMTEAEGRSTEWPIWRDEDGFRRYGGAHAIRFLPAAMRNFIEREQPYNAPQQVSPLDHPLAILQDLWNADKHRTLLAAAAFPNLWAVTIPSRKALGGHRFTDPIVDQGSVVSRFSASVLRAHTEEDLEPNVSVQVTLKEGWPSWGPGVTKVPVNWLINGLHKYVLALILELDARHVQRHPGSSLIA